MSSELNYQLNCQLNYQQIRVNGITLNVAVAGPTSGPLLIFLHGFPEASFAWERYLSVFARAGYRVLAPDQRGYNLSDKPSHVGSYTSDHLIGDVIGLVDAVGKKKASVVGHDWGALVAWGLAIKHRDRIEKIVVMNVPHPRVMRRYLSTHPGQMLRSWYILFFQMPQLPEFLLQKWGFTVLTRMLKGTANPGTFTEESISEYKKAWSQTGALNAMLNWYRAAKYPSHGPKPKSSRVTVPALILWGKHDAALKWEMACASAKLCDHPQLEIYDDATHWVHHEKADIVQARILKFLGTPNAVSVKSF